MTHREHVSKEEAQAFVERIVQLEAELAQAVTRAEAAEQELRELNAACCSVGLAAELRALKSVVMVSLATQNRAADSYETVTIWMDEIGCKRLVVNHYDRRFEGGHAQLFHWIQDRFEKTGQLMLPRPSSVFSENGKRWNAYRAWLDVTPDLGLWMEPHEPIPAPADLDQVVR